MSTDLQGGKRWAVILLQALFVFALSSRMYGAWKKGFEDPVHQPWTVAAGESLAPHQYRVLYPMLWRGAAAVLSDKAADNALLLGTIVLCYGVLMGLFTRASGSPVLGGLALLAFHAACSHPYQFQFRDTFLEITFMALALALQPTLFRRGSWRWFVPLSLLGTLNRETWAFVLFALAVCALREAGGLRALLTAPAARPALLALAASGAVALGVFAGVRLVFGLRAYYCRVMPWTENLPHLLFWRDPPMTFGHGLWAVGGGVFLLYLLSVLRGNRHHAPFIAAYLAVYLPVTFLLARWIESRVFFPLFAVLIASLAAHLARPADPARP